MTERRPPEAGRLATTPNPAEVRVDYVGSNLTVVTFASGVESAWPLDELTDAGPCPPGWPNHPKPGDPIGPDTPVGTLIEHASQRRTIARHNGGTWTCTDTPFKEGCGHFYDGWVVADPGSDQ